MQDKPVPDEELADSQSYLAGSLPLRLETNEGVARALTNIERHNLGLDYLRTYHKMIQSITAEEIQRIAQTWMDADHYALAIAEPEAATEAL